MSAICKPKKGNIIPLCYLINSNPHNTTSEHYALFIIFCDMFGCSFDHRQVEDKKYIKEKCAIEEASPSQSI
jgi:hypothetical protein